MIEFNRYSSAMVWGLVAQEDVQQRSAHADLVVVFEEAEFAEAVHEGIDARSRAAEQAGEGFRRDRRDHALVFRGLAVLRQQQQQPGQAFLGAIEELIHEVGMGLHGAGQQERNELIGEVPVFSHEAKELGA